MDELSSAGLESITFVSAALQNGHFIGFTPLRADLLIYIISAIIILYSVAFGKYRFIRFSVSTFPFLPGFRKKIPRGQNACPCGMSAV